uniref:Uncharacterized protein n=1 Tax=Cannabis sativa TaxID=3483 RepID=A0A803QC27_CANSA
MDNEHKKVAELSEKLEDLDDHVDDVKDQTLVVDDLRDQVKVLKEQVSTLKDQAVLDVTFYDGLCFDAIYNAWFANGAVKSFNWSAFLDTQVLKFVKHCEQHFSEEYLLKIDFTLNGGESVVEESVKAEGYNPEHPHFPLLMLMYQF